MYKLPESDWKKLRSMKEHVLTVACERIFEKIDKIMKEREGQEYESYLALWQLMQNEDCEFSMMFDKLKRSTAIIKLAAWKRNGILSDDQLPNIFTIYTMSTQ